MNETIAVALIVSVVAPVLLSFLTGRQRQADKREDWARQDKVAAQAARAADLLLNAQVATIAATDEVARVAAEGQAATTSTLDQIHTLVNSDMTAARQGELTTTRLLLLALKRLASDDDSPAVQGEIDTAETRADELETIIADRLAAQAKVDANAAAGP